MPSFKIYELKDHSLITPHIIECIKKLLRQLTDSPIQFSEKNLESILSGGNNRLFLLFQQEEVIGMATLCRYQTPTGTKMWIEDVVIEEKFRGQHLGRQLVEHLLFEARQWGTGSLMLTSNPSRKAANHLYQSSGFLLKPTNVYKMTIK